MLEGQALLDLARSLSNRPEDQIARACGYVGPSGRVLKKSFYRALVVAKGYILPSSSSGTGGPKGRQADFRTRVHGNGNLLIGHAYTKKTMPIAKLSEATGTTTPAGPAPNC